MSGLNPRQKKFCHEYVVDFNGAHAAIRAGYTAHCAKVTACNLLKRPDLQAYLKTISDAMEPDIKATAERVVMELTRLAFHDIGSYYTRDKKNNKMVLKQLDELSPHQRAAIQKYDPKTHTMELYNKDPSLDKLGKHFKLFTELNETLHSFTIMPEVKLNGKTVIFNVGEPVKKK